MKTLFASQIQERDWVDAVFLVRDKIVGMAKNGKPYLTLKLMDRSGELEGRIWDRVDELAAVFERDDFIRVAGKASLYMGKMQLVIQEVTKLADEAVDLADFLPVAARPVKEMIGDLTARVASLRNPHLSALMKAFLADEAFLAAYSRAPAAKAMHHVYLGGLLEHSLAVADLAEDICRRYPGLDRDLLIVGALLHDVGKVSELRYARSFEYTDAGKLLGHIVIGVEMVEERLRGLPGFPVELAVLLKHLLLSHHGQYEYGSPKRPKTLEAVILNFIDDLDSKINGVRTHLDKEVDSDSPWTQYHRFYDRYFFKGFGDAPPPGPAIGLPPEPQPAASPAGGRRERPAGPFNSAMKEQLRGVTPDLFGAASEEKNRE
ncbi:MAG: HD domain-containing protein [Deltaproteobacteria bacterium]|nr:MAG: HD domain-containing protein [Deltaproteobacteria bacterium]